MSATVAAYIRQHHLALLCLFLILSGGTAYATHPGGANTVGSGDIINEEVRSQDIGLGQVTSQDIGTGEVLSEDIGNGQVALNDLAANSVSSGKIVDGGILNADVQNNSLTGTKVQDDTLTGADVNESQLDFSVLQARVAQDCLAGESIRSIAQNGQVTCEPDDAGGGTATDLTCTSCVSDAEVDDNLTISGGSVSDGSLSSNVALRGANNVFTGANLFDDQTNFNFTGAEDLRLDKTADATTIDLALFGQVANTSTGIDTVARFQNAAASTVTLDSVLVLDNRDTDTAVQDALLVASSAGGILTALNASEPEIVTALNIGANDIVTSGATISSAELDVLDNGITASDLPNVTRGVNLPLGSFLNATDTEPIDFSSAADDDPDYGLVNSHVMIGYDDGGGANTDSDKIGSTFVVPLDYASGGSFAIRVTQSGANAANLEEISCDVSINGAAASTPGTATLATTTGSQIVFVTPSVTYSAGASVSVNCRQSDAAADDGVRIHGIEFRYTATQ